MAPAQAPSRTVIVLAAVMALGQLLLFFPGYVSFDVLSQLGVKFHGVNILVDPELRQGIKEFSQWPTIPQLYVKGEFIGGCDIIREMFETGELEQVFKEKGVALAEAA